MKPAHASAGLLLVAALSLVSACGGGGGNGGGTPPPTSHAVKLTVTGPGSVNVTGDATGDCQGTCSLSARAGGQVVLTPIPNDGATFEGWSGACSGTGPCTLTVNADVDVGAAFEVAPGPTPTVTLTVARAGDGAGSVSSDPGGVTCTSGGCAGTFDAGAKVTLTASADAGSRFDGWAGGGCAGTGTCELTLTTATTVTARFAKLASTTYAVRIAVSGPGAVEVGGAATARCEGTCSVSVSAGGQVVLTPAASAGATFEGFSGACSGTGPCTLTVGSDVDVAARFAAAPAPTVTLTVARTGDGAGTVASEPAGVACAAAAECAGTFPSGTKVTLTATPDADSRFDGWTGGGCSGTGACEVVLTAATTVTARFAKGAPGTYALRVLSYPGGTLYGAGIDANGDVGGTFSASTCCESQVFLYDAATDRVTLPLPDQKRARCLAVSDAGLLLVTLDDGKTYRFQDGRIGTALGAMTPQAVNVRGWAAGWLAPASGPLHAAVDDGTTVRDLDPYSTLYSTASGINADGRVVGTRNSLAVVFEANGPRPLPVPPASTATDVSDDGKVVGSAKRTFKWPEQAFVVDLASNSATLLDRPSGAVGMSLDHVNRKGTIAVGQLYTADGAGDAFVYRSGKVEPLSGLVQLPPGARILSANGVNDRGQILVSLRDGQGVWSTAILTPR